MSALSQKQTNVSPVRKSKSRKKSCPRELAHVCFSASSAKQMTVGQHWEQSMSVSIDAATTLDRPVSNRRIALWSSIVIVLTLTTIGFVALDSSLTPAQRVALHSGSGAFP
jgi:hypothetical protein